MPFHFLRQDCLPQSNVRPSACLLVCLPLHLHLHLPFPSLLIIFYYYCYYIVIIRHFVVHITAFTLCLAARDPHLPGNRVAQSIPIRGFSICMPSRPPRPAVCHFVAGQIGPFLFTLSPPAREAPSSSHSLVAPGNTSPTRPLFFSSSSLFPSRALCFSGFAGTSTKLARPPTLLAFVYLWLASLLTILPTYTRTTHPPNPCQPCLPALPARPLPTWPPPTAIDLRPLLPLSSQVLPWEQTSQTLTTYRHALSRQLPLPRTAHTPPGHPLVATRPAPSPAATPQPASLLPPEIQHSTWPLQRMSGIRQETLASPAGPSRGREAT